MSVVLGTKCLPPTSLHPKSGGWESVPIENEHAKLIDGSSRLTILHPLFCTNDWSHSIRFRNEFHPQRSRTVFRNRPGIVSVLEKVIPDVVQESSNGQASSVWKDFARHVSGEWDGYGAEFTAKGKPIELPEVVVPEAFREWEVQVYDWQTQCPTLAEEDSVSLIYKSIKLLPTVGCEADAASRHSVVSNWNDNYFVGEIDTFNIYNYALTQAQAAALSLNSRAGCSVTYGVPAVATYAAAPPSAFFDASFTTDPRSGSSSNYGWVSADADDVTCGLQSVHNGILVLNGAYEPNIVAGGYVNMTAASGPDSIGQVLPTIGGTSAGTGSANGWSFEATFKPEVVYTYAKLFDIAAPQKNGNCQHDILFGYYGGFVVNAAQANEPVLQFEVCDGNSNQYMLNGFGPVPLGTWSHVLISVQQSPVDATMATYTAYVNGVRAGASFGAYPAGVARDNGDMGKSSWSGDSYWGGLVDSFRVYNYALGPAQAQALSTAALGTAAQLNCPQATALPSVVPADALIYSLPFSTDPSAAAGGVPLYKWLAVDPTDSAADQSVHKGLIQLGGYSMTTNPNGVGTMGPYVNLSAASGPASVGQVLPLIGTDTAGLWSQGSVGFTLEIVVKMRSENDWAKIFDLGAARNVPGSGSCNGDLVLGWLSNNNQLEFETCTDFASGLSNRLIMTQAPTALNQWLHMVMVVQQSYSNEALAIGYVNGVQAGNLSIAYPYAQYRRDATLGFSDWNDNYINATYDLFNVYNVALNPMQVLRQYGAAFNVPVALPPVSSSSSGAAVAAGSSSSSGSAATTMSSSSSASGVATTSSSSSGAAVVTTSSSSSSAAATTKSSSSSSAAAAAVSSSSSTAAVAAASSSSSTAALFRPSSSSSSTAAVVVSVTSSSSSTAAIATPSTAAATSSTAPVVVASSGGFSSSAIVVPASSGTVIIVPSSTAPAGGPTTINGAAAFAASAAVLAICALASLALML